MVVLEDFSLFGRRRITTVSSSIVNGRILDYQTVLVGGGCEVLPYLHSHLPFSFSPYLHWPLQPIAKKLVYPVIIVYCFFLNELTNLILSS
jgi:hypothetical protein